MSDYRKRMFGDVLSAQMLPSEMKEQHCPDMVFPLILMLRLLLGKSRQVFYKSVELDHYTISTEVFVYDAGSEHHPASFKLLATLFVDTPLSLFYQIDENGQLSDSEYAIQCSTFGAINNVRLESPLGLDAWNPRAGILALLQLAASTSTYELAIDSTPGVDQLKLSAAEYLDSSKGWGWETTRKDLGVVATLHWADIPDRMNGQHENRGDCAFQTR